MKKNTGYTFIEILVVVTLIAVLVMVGVVSYGTITKRTRDARRVSDIEQIRSALEMYRADNGYYPTLALATYVGVDQLTTDLVDGGYISALPTDPRYNAVTYPAPYLIQMTDVRSVGGEDHFFGYCLSALLESSSVENSTCGAISLPDTTEFGGFLYNYGVKNP
jgi:general secretion pathway protein G